MDGVKLSPLKHISHSSGDVLHVIKRSDGSYNAFGEAYFSTVHQGVIKGWKKHTKMTLNLVVPVGEIEFVCFDGRKFETVSLSRNNYQRLTVAPGVWLAFRGKQKGMNMLLNIADIEHDPDETESRNLKDIHYDW